MNIKKLTLIPMMTCIIAISSWITVPSAVPFTLQTFAVFSAVLLLGGIDGLVSVALYVLLGVVGLPVFSGFAGGIGHLLSPTGGYILGFLFIPICYVIAEKAFGEKKSVKVLSLTTGLIICYAVGTVWFTVASNSSDGYGFVSAFTVCVLPYIVPDVLKLALAFFITNKVNKSQKR